MKLLQTRRSQFKISNDQTGVELAEKKTYNALKIQLKEKMSAGKEGWKIHHGSNGPELVKLANFHAPYEGHVQN
ncbi:hypothetical protein QYM36_008077 [Artemia franciscana]|uniref:Uncharacterized protein n=1 Tax=Artemia franciscana TaxID=6661 RepID=A0AA88IEZ6_ARTSF|nr:hypothetical protein QYM36_008077 [Artemia franciscana]